MLLRLKRGCQTALIALIGALMFGCASTSPEAPAPSAIGSDASARAIADILNSPWAQASTRSGITATWAHFELPGKRPTRFAVQTHVGRPALSAHAERSVSLVRKAVRIEPHDLTSLTFSWWVPQLIEDADFSARDFDDSPVRIVLAFDGDTSKFSARDAMLSELSRTLTGEPLPYATLMYSWCPKRPAGAVVINPRTSRIRTLVVESGSKGLSTWLDYERDVRADYERAFGEPPGALIGIAVMSDADNTSSQARAWYGPLRLGAVAGAPPGATTSAR